MKPKMWMKAIEESQEKKHISCRCPERINIAENVHNTKKNRAPEIPIKILEI